MAMPAAGGAVHGVEHMGGQASAGGRRGGSSVVDEVMMGQGSMTQCDRSGQCGIDILHSICKTVYTLTMMSDARKPPDAPVVPTRRAPKQRKVDVDAFPTDVIGPRGRPTGRRHLQHRADRAVRDARHRRAPPATRHQAGRTKAGGPFRGVAHHREAGAVPPVRAQAGQAGARARGLRGAPPPSKKPARCLPCAAWSRSRCCAT